MKTGAISKKAVKIIRFCNVCNFLFPVTFYHLKENLPIPLRIGKANLI